MSFQRYLYDEHPITLALGTGVSIHRCPPGIAAGSNEIQTRGRGDLYANVTVWPRESVHQRRLTTGEPPGFTLTAAAWSHVRFWAQEAAVYYRELQEALLTVEYTPWDMLLQGLPVTRWHGNTIIHLPGFEGYGISPDKRMWQRVDGEWKLLLPDQNGRVGFYTQKQNDPKKSNHRRQPQHWLEYALFGDERGKEEPSDSE